MAKKKNDAVKWGRELWGSGMGWGVSTVGSVV